MMSIMKESYQGIISAGESFSHFLLLALRLFYGFSFFRAGLAKIENIPSVVSMLSSLGIPFPEMNAHLLAWVECVGGACLLFGFAARLVSIPLVIAMLVALFTAHFDAAKKLFEDPQNFIGQSPFMFLLTGLIVFAFGPGKISVDYFIQRFFIKTK